MEGKKVRRKKVSYFSTLVSITLVLFMTGLFAVLIFQANKLKDFIRENVEVSIYFMEDVKESDVFRMEQELEQNPHIRSVKYIDKEEAREIMIRDLGENVIEVLGYNPFPPSLDIYFTSNYTMVDSIEVFKKEMEQRPMVKEVSYQQALVKNIDRNIRIAAGLVLFLAGLLLIIAITLINNTIRLTLFSKRFLIKSMQLVGATRWFIRKPFVLKAVFHGFLGGVIASAILIGVLYFVDNKYPLLLILNDPGVYLMIAGGLIVLGILITGVSSILSVNKYLRMKLDELY